jgi:hypothetical protein
VRIRAERGGMSMSRGALLATLTVPQASIGTVITSSSLYNNILVCNNISIRGASDATLKSNLTI